MMETLKDYFDRRAPSWDELLNYSQKGYQLVEVVRWFNLTRGDCVLDVGTGTGILLPSIRQAIGPRALLIGFDFSFRMLEKAKLREPRGQGWEDDFFKRLELLKEKITPIPEKGRWFIVSLSLLPDGQDFM